jgi:hypothetical protein
MTKSIIFSRSIRIAMLMAGTVLVATAGDASARNGGSQNHSGNGGYMQPAGSKITHPIIIVSKPGHMDDHKDRHKDGKHKDEDKYGKDKHEDKYGKDKHGKHKDHGTDTAKGDGKDKPPAQLPPAKLPPKTPPLGSTAGAAVNDMLHGTPKSGGFVGAAADAAAKALSTPKPPAKP